MNDITETLLEDKAQHHHQKGAGHQDGISELLDGIRQLCHLDNCKYNDSHLQQALGKGCLDTHPPLLPSCGMEDQPDDLACDITAKDIQCYQHISVF